MRRAVPLLQQTLHRRYTPTSTREESLASSLVVTFRGSATSLEQPDFRQANQKQGRPKRTLFFHQLKRCEVVHCNPSFHRRWLLDCSN